MNENEMKSLHNEIVGRLRSVKRDGMEALVKRLEETDYFTAPASTKFHSNIVGGLALHSHYVTNLLLEKNDRFNLGLSKDTCYIAGYLHDLCKVYQYEHGMKIRKSAKTDKWVGYDAFIYKDDMPIGHGDKSVILAEKYIPLTVNEVLMIVNHMGITGNTFADNNFNKAISMCKGVAAIHSADFEASNLMETVHEAEDRPVEEYNSYMANKDGSTDLRRF